MFRKKDQHEEKWKTFAGFMSNISILWKVRFKKNIFVALLEEDGELLTAGTVDLSPAWPRKMAGALLHRADSMSENIGFPDQATENGDREKL